MTVSYAWSPITKSEKQADGTLLVYGPAASSALDRDGQKCDQAWLDQAMPAWMAEGGNVREQHDGKRAVGVGVGLVKGDDGAHLLTARIVDPVAVLKCETGVLKGFSIGIKNPLVDFGKADAPKGLITGGDIIEVSVVDRPANPECAITVAKADDTGTLAYVEDAALVETPAAAPATGTAQAGDPAMSAIADTTNSNSPGGNPAPAAPDAAKSVDAELVLKAAEDIVQARAIVKAAEQADITKDYSDDERKAMAKSGQAMGDGSYPIKTRSDLVKAIKAVGLGDAGHDSIRKHIAQRAAALGLSKLIPKNWNGDGSLSKADAPEDNTDDIATAGQAIAVIAGLIISEAESLAKGNFNEASDIATLLRAVSALQWFSTSESMEDDGDGIDMADQPDVGKADTTQTTDVPANGEDVLTKADIADLVKSAVAEANKTAGERIDALAAELAKAHGELENLKAQPMPGGPALTRTAEQHDTARKSDANRLIQEANVYLAKADAVSDRDLRDGYRQKASLLMAQANA